MAGVGFELKKIFKDDGGLINTLKGYSVTAVVTEGPMVLVMCMLLVQRILMKEFGASYKALEEFLFILTYVMIFSLIFSNTVLMFINRYISDCIYKEEMEYILPSFYGIIFFLLLFSDAIAIIYLMTLPVSMAFRIAALIQFSAMLILWIQMAYLSAIKQYTQILLGFLFGTFSAIGLSLLLMAVGVTPLMGAMWGTVLGFLVMMLMFMRQMTAFYPKGTFNLFLFFPALDRYKSLVATGFLMALGLYAHNFVIWCSEYRNEIYPTGVYCMRYDIPTFFATLTIMPMLVQFVVSLEVNFCVKNRAYFDTILYDGRLEDIRAAKKSMEKVLFRELAHMMELQMIFTIFAVTLLGNYLGTVGLDVEMTGIYRTLCFGYCIYGMVKCLVIILLYFDDRAGACAIAGIFAGTSAIITLLFLKGPAELWGVGFLSGAVISSVAALRRLKNYIRNLEYHVFCEQPLFEEEEDGVFRRIAAEAARKEKAFRERSRRNAQED